MLFSERALLAVRRLFCFPVQLAEAQLAPWLITAQVALTKQNTTNNERAEKDANLETKKETKAPPAKEDGKPKARRIENWR